MARWCRGTLHYPRWLLDSRVRLHSVSTERLQGEAAHITHWLAWLKPQLAWLEHGQKLQNEPHSYKHLHVPAILWLYMAVYVCWICSVPVMNYCLIRLHLSCLRNKSQTTRPSSVNFSLHDPGGMFQSEYHLVHHLEALQAIAQHLMSTWVKMLW